MKSLAVAVSVLCCVPAQAADPAFYVLDMRHNREAVLHSSTQMKVPETGLPYILEGLPEQRCCFVVGSLPGKNASSIKIKEEAPPLSSDDGEETYQTLGHVSAVPSAVKGKDVLAFGIAGMTRISVRENKTYELDVAGSGPIFVRQCLGVEGVNYRLYRSLRDAKPYATYYFALGYPTKPNCK